MLKLLSRTLAAVAAGLLLSWFHPASAQTIDAIREDGRLTCGTVESLYDWDSIEQHGNISGFGAEICRAVATAIFGDPAKLEIVRFPGEPAALAALKRNAIPLVVGLSPSTLASVQYGVTFGRPVFLDSLRFLVAEANHIPSLDALQNRLVCAMDMTPAERMLQDEMAARHITFGLQSHSEQGEMDASVAVAHCAAGAALETRLAETRADFPAKAPPFTFLPERIGIEPIVPAWHYGDQKFGLLVNATVSALIEAEALGITKDGAEAAQKRTDLRAERLVGHDKSIAVALGLKNDWAVGVIRAVGNYGEIFDRTLTKTLGLERGYNALWTHGGLLYPMPLQ